MTIFAVLSTSANETLAANIAREFPNERSIQISDKGWFVSTSGTAMSVSERLGVVRGGELRGVVIAPIAGSYYGIASTNVWEWMKAALEEASDG